MTHIRKTLFLVFGLFLLFGASGSVQFLHCQNANDVLRERRSSPGKIMPFDLNKGEKAVGSIAVGRNELYKNLSPEELIEKVFVRTGSCTSIENVKVEVYGWNGSIWESEARGLAYFEKADSNFPMESGLILSTGDVREAEGPNNVASAMGGGIDNNPRPYLNPDPDLQAILNKQSRPGLDPYAVTNFTVLEFDFVPTGTNMEFKYIFASEEYPSWVGSEYNDVFGFFINKVGDNTKTNLALLPTTDTNIFEVSINNVNNGNFSNYEYLSGPYGEISNSQYFISNPKGNTGTEFNGHTVTLTAKDTLEPCQKYHLKIALGNAGDMIWGSGVFLQSNSFEAGDDIVNKVNGIVDINNVFLDCPTNENKLLAKISKVADQATTIQLEFGGTAVNGVDYVGADGQALKDTYVVPEGKSELEIPYKLTTSASPGKYFNVILSCPCIGGTTAAKKTIKFVNSATDIEVVPTSVCKDSDKGQITVNVVGTSLDYEYSLDGFTWQTANIFPNLVIGTYTVWGRDRGSCKEFKKTVAVEKVIASVGSDQIQCSNTEFVMKAIPLKANETGSWSFVGAALGATIHDVTSPTSKVTVPEGATITLKWTVTNSICFTDASLKLSSRSSLEEFEPIYKTISIKGLPDGIIVSKLNDYCNPVPSAPNWEKVSVAGYIQFNKQKGEISYNKVDLESRTHVFRYTVVDECENKMYHNVYLDMASE